MQPIEQRGWTEQEILDELRMKRGTNHLSFRYDVLDADLNYLKAATNITDCSISNQYLGQIKRTAKFKLVDDGTINFLSNKVKAWVQLHMPPPDPNEPQNFDELTEAIPNGLLRYKLDEPGFLAPARIATNNGNLVASGNNLADTSITLFLPREVPGNTSSLPLWQSGDVAVAIVTINDDVATFGTAPPGWILHTNHTSGSFRVGIYYQPSLPLNASDPVFTFSETQKVAGCIVILRNATLFPFEDTGTANRGGVSSFDLVIPEVTTTSDDQMIVALVADKSSTSTTMSVAGMESIVESFTSGPGSVSCGVFAEVIETAGNTGSRTATWDVASGSAYGLLFSVEALEDIVAVNSMSSTGSEYNGLPFQSPTVTASRGEPPLLGAGGSCYHFDGGDYFLVTGDSNDVNTLFDGLEELTIVSWIKPDAIGIDKEWFGGGDQFGPAWAFDLFCENTNNTINIELTTTAGEISYASKANAQKVAPMCIIFTWKSEEGIDLYIDGVLDTPSATNYTNDTGTLSFPTDAGNVLQVGFGKKTSNISSSWGWQGYVDDISVYGKKVDAATARKIYLAGNKLAMYQDEPIAEWPQGVFVLASPKRETDNTMAVIRDVDAYDQLQVLVEDLIDTRVVAVSGDNYIDVVDGLLGDLPSNLTPSPKVLRRTREWEIGTSKLQIANELIDSINYGSLFFDEHGVCRAEPYVLPGDRAIEHTYLDNLDSVILPKVVHEFDLFANANKWVLLVSDPDSPALKYVLVNDDPASPTSTVARGRTITDYRILTDIPDLATLQEKAELYASNANEVWETIEWTSPIMPFHSIYDVYKFRFLGLNLEEKYLETSWDFQCVQGAHMKHSCRRIVKLSLSEVP